MGKIIERAVVVFSYMNFALAGLWADAAYSHGGDEEHFTEIQASLLTVTSEYSEFGLQVLGPHIGDYRPGIEVGTKLYEYVDSEDASLAGKHATQLALLLSGVTPVAPMFYTSGVASLGQTLGVRATKASVYNTLDDEEEEFDMIYFRGTFGVGFYSERIVSEFGVSIRVNFLPSDAYVLNDANLLKSYANGAYLKMGYEF